MCFSDLYKIAVKSAKLYKQQTSTVYSNSCDAELLPGIR